MDSNKEDANIVDLDDGVVVLGESSGVSCVARKIR